MDSTLGEQCVRAGETVAYSSVLSVGDSDEGLMRVSIRPTGNKEQ